MYALSGNKVRLEPWVQEVKTPTRGTFYGPYAYFLPATPWPLRYAAEIPLTWLEKNPGFCVLLRDAELSLTQEWIIQPENYGFVPRVTVPSTTSKNTLFILHSDAPALSWDDVLRGVESGEAYWTCYNLALPPGWPIERFVNPAYILSLTSVSFTTLIDLNSWRGDTVGPIHLSLIHNGAFFHGREDAAREVLHRRRSFYGEWLIYRPLP